MAFRRSFGKDFEPFFSTKPKEPALAGRELRIIQKHGGAIKVSSQPGRGTTIMIRLPLSRRKPEGMIPEPLNGSAFCGSLTTNP